MTKAAKIEAAPFPSPPGLDAPATCVEQSKQDSAELREVALSHVEEKLAAVGAGGSPEATIQVLREALMEEVEVKIREKTDELWAKGQQKLSAIQQRSNDKSKQLIDSVVACTGRQQKLAEENAKLKELVSVLTSQLRGAGVVGLDLDGADSATGTATAPGLQTPHNHENVEFFTPGSVAPGLSREASCNSVGDAMPSVPFRTPPGTPAPPLSLAEALGSETASRPALSLATSVSGPLPVTPKAEAPSPFPTPHATPGGTSYPDGIGEGSVYTFTIRKADGTDLGLDVSHQAGGPLHVDNVKPNGAVGSWNRQCANGAPEKIVTPGDLILSVNGVGESPDQMLKVCKEKQLLKFCVQRGNRPQARYPPVSPLAPAVAYAGAGLHAGAPAFPQMMQTDAFAQMLAGAQLGSFERCL